MPSFSNLDYLYSHLPARFRRDDAGLFLKRFLTFFGTKLDYWDALFDNFFQSINAQTGTEEFINFWLWALFGWSWYPRWMTLAQKRVLYSRFAVLLARRGTARGIREFLNAFGVSCRVSAAPQVWSEFAWSGGGYSINAPLGIVVDVESVNAGNADGNYWGEFVFGAGRFIAAPTIVVRSEIEALVRFEQPLGQDVIVIA